MTSIEENKELVRRYTREVFDEGNLAAVDEYLAPDFHNHVTGRTGTRDMKRLAVDVGTATGTANVIDLLVAEGDLVVAHMTITRTLHRELRVFGFTFPGDGRSYTVKHVHIYRVAGGKIREHWAVRDDLSMLRQLGALSAVRAQALAAPDAAVAEPEDRRRRSLRAPKIVEDLEMALGELQIEWIAVPDDSPWIGKTRAECGFRAKIGITVIAILRQPQPVTGAQPADTIERDDTLVTVGKAGQYPEFRRLLRSGDPGGSSTESSEAGK